MANPYWQATVATVRNYMVESSPVTTDAGMLHSRSGRQRRPAQDRRTNSGARRTSLKLGFIEARTTEVHLEPARHTLLLSITTEHTRLHVLVRTDYSAYYQVATARTVNRRIETAAKY